MMTILLGAFLVALMTRAVVYLLSESEFFEPLRKRADLAGGWAGEVLHCPYCCGVPAAAWGALVLLPVLTGYTLLHAVAAWLGMFLAGYGLFVILYKLQNDENRNEND